MEENKEQEPIVEPVKPEEQKQVPPIQPAPVQEQGTSKTGIGVICALFLGLIGLVIGLCCYKDGSIERKTFLKAWVITFCVSYGVGIILGIIIYAVGIPVLANSAYYY